MLESELIRGLENGEDDAIDTVVNLYADRLLRLALAITGDPQLAEEVVWDTFFTVCRKINTFRQEASFETWLFRIAVNLSKNKVRGGWFKRVVAWDDKKVRLIASGEQSPEHLAIAREEERAISECLRLLPAMYKDVLVLYYLESFSVKEIAGILSEPEGTVKSKLSRGRAKLKEILERRGVKV